MLIRILRFFFRFPRRRAGKKRRVDPSKHRIEPRGGTYLGLKTLSGRCYVIDGDTITIRGVRIRIFGIDAPELDHPWGRVSKGVLIKMCKGKTVTAVIQEDVSFDRLVAKCYLPDGTDIAAELVQRGVALDWPRFSGGIYSHLEPEGARKKMWRASMKQGGRPT